MLNSCLFVEGYKRINLYSYAFLIMSQVWGWLPEKPTKLPDGVQKNYDSLDADTKKNITMIDCIGVVSSAFYLRWLDVQFHHLQFIAFTFFY